MRPLLATFLLIAVLATGALVAVDLAFLLAPPSNQQQHLTAPDASSNDVKLIHAFYDVANTLMVEAGAQIIGTVASPGVLLHQDGFSPRAGSDEIAAHFTALSRSGRLRFHISRVVADETGYLVLVDVNYAGAGNSVSGERNPRTQWTTTDRIEISDGLIDEYWPGSLPMPANPPLPLVHLERIPRNPVSALARLELAPGTSLRALRIPAQQILVVESGEITLEVQESVHVSRGGAPWQDEELDANPTEPRSLAPGDAILAPDGGLRFSNTRSEPASLLSVLIVSGNDLFGPKHALSDDLLVAVAMHDPKRLASPSTWTTGVTSTALAVAGMPVETSSLDVSGRTISLAPGQRCADCASSATAFAIVNAGFLEIAREDTMNVSTTPSPSAKLLWPGDATTLDRDSSLSLENAGPSELTMSLIDLVPGATLPTPRAP